MKKLSLIILVLLLTALAFTACAKQPEATQAPASEKPAAEQPKAEEPKAEEPSGEAVTIRVWTHQNNAFNGGYQALADQYMAEHPNVTIKFESFDYDTYIQTLQTALPAGTEADILQMFGSWVCSYAEGNTLAEVPADVLTLDDAQSKILAAPIGGYICDGKLYGIPQEYKIEYGAVMVNTKLADVAGATNYKEGWKDWDAFIEDAKKLTVEQDGVMTRAGFNFTGSDGIATMFHSLILQYGGQYLQDGEYTVTTPEGQKTLELMKRLVDEGLVDPVLFNDTENWVGDSYFEETSAIGLVGPWAIPEYSGDYPEVAAATKYVRLPSVGDTPVFAAASGWGLTVSANSKVQDAAWDFVKYVTLNADNAVSWNLASGTLPALNENLSGANADKLVSEFSYFEPFLDLLQYGQFEGHFPDRDFVWYEVTYPEVLNFLQGNSTIDDTLQTIQDSVRGSFQ
jgi:multiple sugar transport system substrate-binding protein